MNRNELFKNITLKIINKIKQGTLPWRRTWEVGIPQNFISKRPYNGINFVSLSLEDFPSPYFLTYLQCKELNGYILKGAKSQRIVFWKILEIVNDANEEIEIKQIPFLRIANVFNLSQTSLFKDERKPIKPINCEAIERKIFNMVTVKNNFQRCYYNTKKDYISLPKAEDFNSMDEYFSALFHEAAHATGHPTRLNRSFNKKDYAKEELIAELTASYLCAYCGIENKTLDNQAAYLSSWLKSLENDTTFILKASSLAGKAAEFILYG
jgi:antirestriction protein ArdC